MIESCPDFTTMHTVSVPVPSFRRVAVATRFMETEVRHVA